MAMDCSMRIAKLLLFVFNFLFFLIGIIMLIVGGLALSQVNKMIEGVQPAELRTAALLLLVLGGAIFLIAFLGCCGAAMEISTMLYVFAGLLTIFLLVQVIVGIFTAAAPGKLKGALKYSLFKSGTLEQYDPNNNATTGATAFWDNLQTGFKCCGVEGYKDWNNNTHYAGDKGVPDSCCKPERKNPLLFRDGCGESENWLNHIYKKGCAENIFSIAKKYLVAVTAVTLGLAVIEIFGICMACKLARAIR